MADEETAAEAVSEVRQENVRPGNPTMEQVRAERQRAEEAAMTSAPDDDTGEIPPPRTGSFVRLPKGIRDDESDHEDHEVQVVQVFTGDDLLPRVSLRCSCAREYSVDWSQDLAKKVIRASRLS